MLAEVTIGELPLSGDDGIRTMLGPESRPAGAVVPF
jgi:hypothetical protein